MVYLVYLFYKSFRKSKIYNIYRTSTPGTPLRAVHERFLKHGNINRAGDGRFSPFICRSRAVAAKLRLFPLLRHLSQGFTGPGRWAFLRLAAPPFCTALVCSNSGLVFVKPGLFSLPSARRSLKNRFVGRETPCVSVLCQCSNDLRKDENCLQPRQRAAIRLNV